MSTVDPPVAGRVRAEVGEPFTEMTDRRKIFLSDETAIWVDGHVAPLALALDCFEAIGSIRQVAASSDELATIQFRVEGTPRQAVQFVAELKMRLDTCLVAYRLGIEWRQETPEPVLSLSCRDSVVIALAAALGPDPPRPAVGRTALARDELDGRGICA